MFQIKNRNDLQKLEELASLQNQVEELRLQDKPGGQNYQQKTKKLFETLTDAIKNTYQDIIKAITKTSFKNNQAVWDLNENVLELMNGKGMIVPYLASSSVNLLKPENKSQFLLIKDYVSTRMNDFLLNTTIPVTLNSKMLIFRDSIKSFKLDEGL